MCCSFVALAICFVTSGVARRLTVIDCQFIFCPEERLERKKLILWAGVVFFFIGGAASFLVDLDFLY